MKIKCNGECGRELEWTKENFYARKDENGRLRKTCKLCLLNKRRKRSTDYIRNKRHTDPEFKRRQKESLKRWVAKNKDKVHAINRRSYQKHEKKYFEHQRKWFKNAVDTLSDEYIKRMLVYTYKMKRSEVKLDRLRAFCQLHHLRYDAKEKYRRVMNKPF